MLPSFTEIVLSRVITKDEIESNKDRFYRYNAGELCHFFRSWKDVIIAGKIKLDELNIKNVKVEGIPNNSRVSLEYALSKEVDTRFKCSICGKVINGNFYNLPSGAQCIKCHEKQ